MLFLCPDDFMSPDYAGDDKALKPEKRAEEGLVVTTARSLFEPNPEACRSVFVSALVPC